MALTYIGGAEASGNSASFNISLSALSLQPGDLVVVSTGFVQTVDGNPGVTTAGYTEVADLRANDTRDANLSVNWKLMGATPDTSVACNGSLSATNGAVGVVHAWRGVDQTNPLDTTPTTATGTNASPPNSPTITPITAGAVIIATGLGTSTAVDNSVTAPAGYSNQVDISIDPGNAATVGIASKAWVSGAEDAAAWTTWTTATSDSWCAVSLAIRPYVNQSPIASQVTPIDGQAIENSTLTLSFNSTDAESDNVEYNIQIDTVDTFNSGSLRSAASITDAGFSIGHPFIPSATVNYTIQTAITPGTYYWRVRAIDPSGSNTYGPWSSTRNFNLPSNISPTVQLNSPSDTITGQNTTPTFNFTGADPENNNLEYEIQVDSLNSFDSISGGSPNILFSNSFESSSWTSVLVSGSGGAWTIATTSTNPTGISPQDGSNLARFNSYTCQANVQARFYPNTTFNIPAGANAINLKFWIYHETGYSSSNDQIQPQISTNGGTDWTNIGIAVSRYNGATGWEEITVSLDSYNGVSNILVGFLGISGYGNDCYIDNTTVSYTLPNTPLLDKKSDLDNGFTSGHPYSSGLATDYTVQSGQALTEGLIYYWRARAIDPLGSGGYGAWSATYSFSVGNVSPSVSLNSPTDTELASTTPILNFTGSDPEADKIEYKLEIDTVNTFDSQSGNPLLSAASTSSAGFSDGHPYDSENSVDYQVQSPLALGTYYWRVSAIDPLGHNIYGAWSNIQSFVTVSNAPPSVALNSPNDNATGKPVLPVLKFTGTDPEGDNVEYEVQLDTVNTFDSNGGGSGNILFSNSFEAAGWTSTLVSGTAAAWSIVTSSAHPTGVAINNGTRMACFNSYSCTANAQARYYPSTTFSIPSNAGSPNLTYWFYHETLYPTNNERVQLQASLNGGTNWTNVGIATSRYNGTTGWAKVIVDLSKYTGKGALLIGFLGISGYGNDCYIDNVTVTYNLPLIDKVSTTDIGFSAGHPFTSGNITTYAVQAANALTNNVTYYWRVRAIDQLGRNSYGFWSETRSLTPNTGMKIWNGTAWVYKPVRMWNGATWEPRIIKIWDGDEWVING